MAVKPTGRASENRRVIASAAHPRSRRIPSWQGRPPTLRPPPQQFLAADLSGLGFATVAVLGQPAFAALAPFVMIAGLRLGDLYKPATSPSALDQVSNVARGIAIGALALAAATSASAHFALTYAVVATASVVMARSALFMIHRRVVVRRPRRVLIVGTGNEGQELADRLLDHPEFGMVPVGFVADDPEPLDPTLPVGVVAGLDELLSVVDSLKVERVIVDAGAVDETELLHVLDGATQQGVEVTVLPVLAQHLSTAISVESLAATTLLTYRPSRHRGVTWTLKRVTDIAASALGLALLMPVLVAVAVAIKLESRGPVLFRQKRVGRNGSPFMMLKFRSMVVGADRHVIDLREHNVADGPYFKILDDPRVTRVGRFMRRFSLDELPQLVNVLRGEMSLVGPRPALPHEVAEYPAWFRRRLMVPPGITGLWQIRGRFLLSFGEATRSDVFYVDHWSLGLDIKILLRTIPVVIAGRGAR